MLKDLLIEKDVDNNNALHFAAYCGQVDTIEELCEISEEFSLMKQLDVYNNQNETPVNVSYKKGWIL